jgi:hypothetical protein
MVLFWCVLGRATVDMRCRPVYAYFYSSVDPELLHRRVAGWVTGRWRTLLSSLVRRGGRGSCIDYTAQLHLWHLQRTVFRNNPRAVALAHERQGLGE